eukprot:2776624-Rhodomonas_salina.2
MQQLARVESHSPYSIAYFILCEGASFPGYASRSPIPAPADFGWWAVVCGLKSLAAGVSKPRPGRTARHTT